MNIGTFQIFKNSPITTLYKEIESGIPFYQVANKFDISEAKVKEVFYSKKYKEWLSNR